MRRIALLLLLLAACGRELVMPQDTMLWRLDRDWSQTGEARTARATILTFRSSGEFVELHCWVIERPDGAVYVASDRPRVVAVGRWKREKNAITADRSSVAGAPASVCAQPRISMELSGGRSIMADVGNGSVGAYSPVTRLIAPEFESYVNDAKRSTVICPAPPAE